MTNILRFCALLLLFKALPVIGSDTAKINRLFEFIDKNRHDSAAVFKTSQQVIAMTEGSSGFDVYYGKALLARGVLFYYYVDYDSAGYYFDKSREIFLKLKDTLQVAKATRLQGIIFERRNQLTAATSKFLETLKLYEKVDDEKGMSEAYLSLAIVFQRQSLFDQALQFYKKSLGLSLKNGYEKVLPALNSNIASIYTDFSNYDSAIKYFNEALKWSEKIGDIHSSLSAYQNLGFMYVNKGDFKMALHYYRKVRNENYVVGPNNETIGILVTMGHIFLNLNQLDSAEYYIRQSLEVEKLFPSVHKKNEALYNLAEIYEKRGNYKDALKYMKESYSFNDSAYKINMDEKLREMQANFLSQEKDRENERLKEIEKSQQEVIDYKARQNVILIVLIVALLCLVVVLFINIFKVMINRKRLRTLNTELEKQHSDLEAVIQEKNDLVGALAHDLRAPFSKIINLSVLVHESTNQEEEEEYLAMIENLGKDGLSLIQDLIDLSRMVSMQKGIDLYYNIKSFNVDETLQKLLKTYQKAAAAKKIEMVLTCDTSLVMNSRRDFFERICDNVISNALKYTPVGSEVNVEVKTVNSMIEVHVKDQGPGFSAADYEKLFQKFQRLSARPTGLESSTGLGLFIARNLALALKGDLELISSEGESAHFCIRFPINLEIIP